MVLHAYRETKKAVLHFGRCIVQAPTPNVGVGFFVFCCKRQHARAILMSAGRH